MISPTTTIKAAALIAALYLPVQAGQPLTIIIDGQPVGTLSEPGLVYDTAAGTISITTHERVFGCRQDRVFWDRFEHHGGIE